MALWMGIGLIGSSPRDRERPALGSGMGTGAGVVAGGGTLGWCGEGANIRGLFTLVGVFVRLGGLRIVDLTSSELYGEDSIVLTGNTGRVELTGKATAMSVAAANGLWG